MATVTLKGAEGAGSAVKVSHTSCPSVTLTISFLASMLTTGCSEGGVPVSGGGVAVAVGLGAGVAVTTGFTGGTGVTGVGGSSSSATTTVTVLSVVDML